MSLPIGFFAPLPLPMMIAFMGIQSAVMAEQFGTMFQYGKRRISAMSNEEFNDLVKNPKKMQEIFTNKLVDMIPEMERQIQAMGPMVNVVIHEFGIYLDRARKEFLAHGGDIIKTATESAVEQGFGFDSLAHLVGQHTHGITQTGSGKGNDFTEEEVSATQTVVKKDVPVVAVSTRVQQKFPQKFTMSETMYNKFKNVIDKNWIKIDAQANILNVVADGSRTATAAKKRIQSLLTDILNIKIKIKEGGRGWYASPNAL